MSMLLMRRALMGGAPDIALKTIQSYGTPAFYLPDPDPALRMPSGLRRGYQDFANTPVTAATQTAALALDLSEGAAIGAEIVDNPGDPFTSTDNWDSAEVNGTVSVVSGKLRFTATAAATTRANCDALTTVVGGLYEARVEGYDGNGGTDVIYFGTGIANPAYGTLSADGVLYFIATTTTAYVTLRNIGPQIGHYVEASRISIKRVAGYHFYQATSADEPTLNLTSGLYGYLGDGASKHFRTGLVPSNGFTMMAAVNFAEQDDRCMGAQVGSGVMYLLSNPSTGVARAAVGNTGYNISAGSIIDVPGIIGVSTVGLSGGTYVGIWKPIGGALETASGSFTGTIPTTQPLWVLSDNDDGAVGKPAAATGWRFAAQQSSWTLAEMTAIANQWSRELAALA